MDIRQIATPMTWRIDNPSASAAMINITGWRFGATGSNKPIMLMHHANGMCGALWAPVAQTFTATHAVYAIDARGHGDSDSLSVPQDYKWDYLVADLCNVAQLIMAEQNQQQIAIGVGSSFGGIVTAAAAAQHPDLFDRVVMLDPPIHSTPDLVQALNLNIEVANNDDRADLVAMTLKRRGIWPSRVQARQAWQDKPLFAAWQPEAFTLYLNEGMADLADGTVGLKCDPAVEAHIFSSTGSLGVQDYAPKVQAPVNYVHAQHGFFSADFSRIVAGLFPNGHFDQLPGGHMLPLEIPELVIEYLRELV